MSVPFSPGSDLARGRGCICPVLDNAHGLGYMGVAGVHVYREDCPYHCPAPARPDRRPPTPSPERPDE